ncbi:zinc finger FYVE domain-containing protein 19, partial [Asbolus verrucosus]
MSCNHCNTKFNFFHKEMGCSNCGLSFCNKCLKQKCKIPNKGPSEHNVCKLCYSKLASGTSTTQPASVPPPDIFLKRLENLENPLAPPITMYKQDSKIQALRSGLSPADQKILDRLEKLKEEKGPPPTEGELRRRLASLKGENDYVEGPSKTLFAVDTRTDQQKADSLLEQFVSERDIELAHNPQDEIEARLATLREQGVRPNEGPYISNLHDSSSSEEDVDKITKK